jgi:hypothetical protein
MSNFTTLILGAGASKEYGYPLGSQLIKDIVELDVSEYIKKPKELEIARHWQIQLRNAQRPSIDDFMNRNPVISANLRPLMLIKMLEYENEAALFKLNESHWYQTFFGPLIGAEIEDTKANFEKVKVLTFNYDRSLEYYLMRQLQSCHQISEASAFGLLKNLEIIHVYDRLHPFPEETDDIDMMKLQYGPDKNRDSQEAVFESATKLAKHRIKTCFEPSPYSEKCHSILSNSRNILFLGFAYHENNLKALNYNFRDGKEKRLYGTCLGMDKRVVESLRPELPNINFINDTCLGLLQKHYSFRDGKTHYLEI